MKWILVGVAAIVVLAIAALAAVLYLVDLPRVQALIATNASQALECYRQAFPEETAKAFAAREQS